MTASPGGPCGGAALLTLQIVVSGILLGGLYACMAIGFSIIWGVTGLINLAHGSMILIGAYLTWWLHSTTGIDPFLTLPMSARCCSYSALRCSAGCSNA